MRNGLSIISRQIRNLPILKPHPSFLLRSADLHIMSATPTATTGQQPPRKLKILMLHGFTQNGPLFHAKTRALEKLLLKAFPSTQLTPLKSYPGGVELLYPTGPIGLEPADIPGFDVKEAQGAGERDAWGWWKREPGSGKYVGLEEGLATIAETIKSSGPIDGVVGFSQGGAAAALVASLLEEGRKDVFGKMEKENGGFAWPAGFEEGLNEGKELRFAVSYSGFFAPNEEYRAFYEPKIKTPFLHFIGSLDSVVEESRCLALVAACEKDRVVYHPGGHFVPIGKEMASMLVAFIKDTCADPVEEESAEDMDVPF